MRDLETQNLRTLPERLETAQRKGMVSDQQLAELMGWKASELAEIKAGERKPTPGEMRALYGVFGKSSQGLLKTRYRKGEVPPRRPADWVVLEQRQGQSELDRLHAENESLRAELEALREAERGFERVAARLSRALARRS